VGAAVVRSPPPALQQTNDSVVPAAPVLTAYATSPEEETTVLGRVIINLIREGGNVVDENRLIDASAGY